MWEWFEYTQYVCDDTGEEVLTGTSVIVQDVPVMTFYQTPTKGGGRIVAFGDSNCLDSAHMQKGGGVCLFVCFS